jgi:hypothetical protein
MALWLLWPLWIPTVYSAIYQFMVLLMAATLPTLQRRGGKRWTSPEDVLFFRPLVSVSSPMHGHLRDTPERPWLAKQMQIIQYSEDIEPAPPGPVL